MALARTILRDLDDASGRHHVTAYDLAPDTAYPMGGYAIEARDVALKEILGVEFLGGNAAAAAYRPFWDNENGKFGVAQGASGGSLQTYIQANILGSANTDSVDTDEAAKPTNADAVDTLHAVASGAWTYSEDAEPDIPRNVVILLKADVAGSTVPASLSFLVTGTYLGAAQTETIAFAFTDTTLAGNQHRYKYGVKPFETITTVVATGLTGTQDGLLIGVGIGSLLGLPATIDAASDVISAQKNAAPYDLTGNVSAANETVNFGTLADNDDISVDFIAGLSGTDLSALKFRARFIGF